MQSVAAGDLSPAEAATLLDALPADDQAEPPAAAVPAAEATPAEAAAPASVPAPAAVLTPPVPPTPPVPADPADVVPPPPPPVAPAGPDETQEFRRPLGSGASTGRDQVFIDVNAGGPISIICSPDVTEAYADGPNSVTVVRVDGRTKVQGGLGDDAAVMVPSEIDLTVDASGADFSLVGLVGTVSADLNCGDVTISGVFAQGDSRIHANAGDIDVTFMTGSDVEVIAKAPATLSADGLEHVGRGRWSLGDGTAKLEIDGNVGGINLRTN